MYVLDREKNPKTGRTVTTYPWAKNMRGKTFLERGRVGVQTLEDPCCQYGAFPALSREQTLESCLSRNNGNVQQKKLKVVSREDNVRKRGGWRTRRGQLGMQRMLFTAKMSPFHKISVK